MSVAPAAAPYKKANSIHLSELTEDDRAKRDSVGKILKSMDKKGTGEIDATLLMDIVEKQRDKHVENKRQVRLIMMLMFVVIVTTVTNFFMITSNRKVTDEKIEALPRASADGSMIAQDGTAVTVANPDMAVDSGVMVDADGQVVQVDQASSLISIWNVPFLTVGEMTRLQSLVGQMVMPDGSLVDASFTIAAAYKPASLESQEAYTTTIEMVGGHRVTINPFSLNASVTLAAGDEYKMIFDNSDEDTVDENAGGNRRLMRRLVADSQEDPTMGCWMSGGGCSPPDEYEDDATNNATDDFRRHLQEMHSDGVDDIQGRRELLWDFGCCSGGLANPFSSGDGADCNVHPWKHETGAGYQLSAACRTHDSCLLACNGACACRGDCDTALARSALGASCNNGKSWWGYRYSCSCGALKPLLIAAMVARPNQWLLGEC